MIPRDNIFVDTGAWVALADRDDAHHQKAASVYPSLLAASQGLITSNLVIAEAYIIILNELGHGAAIGFLESLKASPRISMVYSDEGIEGDAIGTLKKYSDQRFSYTDAVSFAIMRKLRMKKAFCFDKHFATAGFVCIP